MRSLGRVNHWPPWKGWSWTRISEPGVQCTQWRFLSVNVSHISSSPLLPAYAGQIFSYRHKATCKWHQRHLFMGFARLTVWSASTHSSTSNQYGHWKPLPAWSISAAPISYLWGFNSTHSFCQGRFFSPQHPLKMRLCPGGCSALLYHKTRPQRGWAVVKAWKLKGCT